MESKRRKKKSQKSGPNGEKRLQQTMDAEIKEETEFNYHSKVKKKRKLDDNETLEPTSDELKGGEMMVQEDNVPRKKKKKKHNIDSDSFITSHERAHKSNSLTDLKTKTVKESCKSGTESLLMKKLEAVTGNKLGSDKHRHENDQTDLVEVPNSKKNKNKKKVFKMEETGKTETANDEEIDPEKEAIRQKKREKRRLKKLEKQNVKEAEKARYGTAKESAKQYLKQWDTDRDNWRFQKVRQVWLLQNMFNVSLIDDELFEILLRYLEPLKGRSREETVKTAEKVMKELEENINDPVQEERAKHVIQLLS